MSPPLPAPAPGRARSHRPLGFPLLIALACLVVHANGCEADSPADPTPTATIRGQVVTLEIARSAAEQQRGLSYRDSLDWGHGMLFLYDEPQFYGFWMKGMRFDIDIVWIRGRRIIDISHRVQHSPGSNGPTVRPREVADTVLEVPAGFAAAAGWQIGDLADLDLGKPPAPQAPPAR